ncbi:DUF1648 domain-containing protein [Chryseobacterium sp. SN22]|uniref:DUF1648 domain-containing protein n=1 Tax=Chryseobacterium sp. SN22 TaxID=2606431 RepID=UPI0011EC6772|nr:DUF1648 domain-containing protein [Chryseobacterium sp. SN22]KAA0129162.1 DUF1648 domain-containing protein [Chryseobacterium sp. SN22]
MENILLGIFDILNFGLLAFLWWFTIKHYTSLPQTIPTHFDFDGKADQFGSKKYSFLMPAVLTVLYFLFAYVVRTPESSNYPVEITEENENAQFLIMKIFIRWLFLLISFLFLNNQDYMFRYSRDEAAKPRVAMSFALFSVIGSLIILFIFVGVFK